jgi:hypothetical protein
MADISITAANVLPQNGAVRTSSTAGATVTAGQVVYLEASTQTCKLCDVNSATAEARTPYGLALHGALTGQPLTVQTAGPVALGTVLTAGVAYYASGTAGGIRPAADNTTGDYPALLGMSTSTSVLNIDIQAPGAVL